MSTTSVIYNLIGRDSASPAFDKAGASASRLERTVSRVSRTVALAGEAIAGAAIVIGAESVKSAVSFQASMEKIHTQAGATQKDVESLTKSVLKLAPSTQQGPQQLADALYHLKSVGLDNASAMKALKTASDLAAVGGSNLEDTTNALAGAWRTGIKGATDFGQAASTVNAIIGAGNMRMADFVEAIGTGILPTAKTFGLTLKQVGAALALMTDEGVPAVDAATRLRMSFSLLGAPSKAADKELKAIGLSGLDLAQAMRGPQGIIGAISLLKDHLDSSGLSASRQAQVLSRAFGGGRSSSAILTLINNLDVLRRKQTQINDTTGKYGDAVAAQRKTAQAQFDLLRSSIDTLGIRLGMDLLPPVTRFVSWLASKGIPGVEKFTKRVASMLPVKQVEDEAAKIIGAVERLFGIGGSPKGKPKPVPIRIPYTLAGSQGQASLASMLGEHTAAAQARAKAMPVQVPYTVAGMKAQSLSAMLHAQVKASPVEVPFTAAGTKAQQSMAAMLGSSVGKSVSKGVSSSLNSLPAVLTMAFHKVKWAKVLADVINGAVSGAQEIGAAFITLLGKINWTSFGGTMATALVGLAVGLVNNLIPALIGEAIHHPLDMLMFITSLIPIGRVAGILVKIFAKVPLLGPLLKFFLVPLEKAGGFVESALGKILGKVFGPVGRLIKGYFKDALSWLRGQGETILLGLWYGAEAGWRFVTRWLGKIFGWVLSPFEKAGSWLLDAGKEILTGLLDGAKFVFRFYVAYWKTVFEYTLKVFARAGTWLLSKGSDLVGGLLSGAERAWRAVAGWLGGAGGRVLGFFAKAGTWLYDTGSHLIGGLKSGIVDAFRGIGHWIKSNIVDPVINWVKHFFGINSPSTVMAWVGGHLMGGLFKGMLSHDLTGMVKTIFGSLPSALGAIVDKGLVSLAKLPGKALKALGGLGGKALGWLGHLFGGGGGNGANMSIGQAMAAAMGWTGSQWDALRMLWTRESGWRTNATNPQSGAYGIPQSLPAGKMASAGPDWLTNPATQIRWGLGYIAGRYGSPLAAWAHELSAGWYARGGKVPGSGNSDSVLAWLTPGEAVIPRRLVPLFAAALKAHGVPGFASGGLVARHRAASQRAAATALRTEQGRGETVADAYMSGLVNTLSKIQSEQRAAVRAIQKYYGGHAAAWREGLIGAQSRRLEGMAARLAALTAQHNAAASYQQSVASGLSGYGALSGLTVDPFLRGGGIASQLQAKLAQLRKFAGAIGRLRKAGLSGTLLRQVVAMGPDDGYTYAQAMLSGGTSLIRQINAAEGAIDLAAGNVAHTAAVAVYGKSIVDGFKGQQAALEKQMRSLGDVMGREVARWLHVPGSKLPHYAAGGTFAANQLITVGELGEEVVSFGRPGRVFSHEESAALIAAANRGSDGGGLHVGEVHVHHVPGYSTPKDVENGLQMANRQIRLSRR